MHNPGKYFFMHMKYENHYVRQKGEKNRESPGSCCSISIILPKCKVIILALSGDGERILTCPGLQDFLHSALK